MQYRIVRSEDELAHHGVKGMRWGVRRYQNADGSLTDAGKKRLAKNAAKSYATRSALRYDFYRDRGLFLQDNKELLGRIDTKKLEKTKREYEDAVKIQSDFYNNDKLWRKYALKAAANASKKHGIPLEEAQRGYLHEDLDQGDDDSFSFYLKDKFGDPKKYHSRMIKADEAYTNACKEAVQEILGEYGSTKIKVGFKSTGQTVEERIVADLVNDTAARVQIHDYAMWAPGWNDEQ